MKEGQYDTGGVIIGIDVGSVSISVVCMNMKGELVDEDYSLHHGNIRASLDELLHRFRDMDAFAVTPAR